MVSTKNPRCLLIDPYVSTEMLVETLRKKGIFCIALFTYSESSKVAKKNFHPSLFDQIIHLTTENREEVLKALGQIDFVQAGREYSVEMADEIAMRLSPKYANSSSTSIQRMNKYEMQEAARRAGLKAALQYKISRMPLSSEDKKELKKFPFPVILKPLEASGTLGVRICPTMDDVYKNLEEVVGKKTPVGNVVQGVVVQEVLRGDEYIVDSVSLEGKHVNTCVFRCGKILYQQVPIYRYIDVVDFETEEAKSCCDYIKKTLSAVGLNNGLSHAELMLTPDGPCLIEINPRISGMNGFLNHVARRVFGLNQVDVLAEVIKEKKIPPFQAKASAYSRIIIVQNFHKRTLNAFNEKRLLQTLSSYVQHQSFITAGQQHTEAKILTDAIAYVSLVHKSQKQIEADTKQIWQWEENGQLF